MLSTGVQLFYNLRVASNYRGFIGFPWFPLKYYMDDFEVVLMHLNTSKKTNTTKPPSVVLGFPTI
jgi:hypothetical protein